MSHTVIDFPTIPIEQHELGTVSARQSAKLECVAPAIRAELLTPPVTKRAHVVSRPLAFLLMFLALVAGTIASTMAAEQRPTVASSPENKLPSWRRLADCPVLVEESVEVPALESGLIVELAVTINQAVTPNQLIAKLDQQQAGMAVEMAKLKYKSALSLAEDKSEIDYQQLALQEIQSELSSYEKISTSVSSSEIRRLNLQVGKARLALVRARQASARAQVEAQILDTEIRLAEDRLNRRTVQSPLAGIVSTVEKQVGQWVQAGETIAKIENLNELGVDAIVPVDSIDLGTIAGSEVRVIVAQPDTSASPEDVRLPGKVTSYDHKVSGRGLIRLHCRVRNATHRGRHLLLPGMNVDLEISSASVGGTAAPEKLISR